MFCTTEAIVIHFAHVKDNSSILHVYTKEFGKLSILVYGNKHNFTRLPLNLLSVELNYQSNKTIQSAKEIHLSESNNSIYQDIKKQTIALFIAEVIYLTLTQEMKDEQIYNFLHQTIYELNKSEHPENLHIEFLITYATYLGIGIDWELNENAELKELLSAYQKNNTLTRKQRQSFLKKLCLYYEKHIDSFSMPSSLDILETVFD